MKVVWLAQANEDRVAIYDYIEQESLQNAVAVDEAFIAAVELISKFPHLGRSDRRKDIREWVVANTGFILFYRIQAETIEIVALMRGTRRRAGSAAKL